MTAESTGVDTDCSAIGDGQRRGSLVDEGGTVVVVMVLVKVETGPLGEVAGISEMDIARERDLLGCGLADGGGVGDVASGIFLSPLLSNP